MSASTPTSRSTKSPSTSSCACRTSWRRRRSTTGATRSAIRPPRPALAMFSKSPHSAWHSDDLDAKIGPLWGEKDEKKRIAGWKDGRPLHRRAGLRAAAAAIRPADPLQVRSQGDPEQVRRLAAGDAGLEGLTSTSKRSAAAPGRGGHRRGQFKDRCMLLAVVVNRVAMALLTLAGVAVIVFVLLRVVPGDPVAMMISPGATACRHRRAEGPLRARRADAGRSSGSGSGAWSPAISAPRSRCICR